MFKRVTIAAAALAISVPASAQITFDDGPPAANAKDPKSKQIICQRVEEVGSRVGAKKVCLTAAQWEERRRQESEAVQNAQRQNTSTGTPSGGI